LAVMQITDAAQLISENWNWVHCEHWLQRTRCLEASDGTCERDLPLHAVLPARRTVWPPVSNAKGGGLGSEQYRRRERTIFAKGASPVPIQSSRLTDGTWDPGLYCSRPRLCRRLHRSRPFDKSLGSRANSERAD